MKSKISLTIILLLLVGVVGGVVYMRNFFNFAGLCGNEVLETSSPNSLVKSIVFVRNCGATTDWSVHVSILSTSEELGNADTGNIFIASTGSASTYNPIGGPFVKAVWKNNTDLEIQYSEGSEIFLEAAKYGGTTITYSSF